MSTNMQANKRQKLSPSTSSTASSTLPLPKTDNQTLTTSKTMDLSDGDKESEGRNQKEEDVGILQYVNTTNPGFTGILKQRYTDFHVNEIMEDGTVAHLTDVSEPKPVHAKQEIKAEPVATAFDAQWSKTDGTTEQAITQTTIVDSNVKQDETATAKGDTELTEASDVKEEHNVDAAPEAETGDTHMKVEAANEGAEDVKTEANESKDGEAKDETSEPAENVVGESPVSDDDYKLLTTYFGAEVRDSILALYKKVLQRPDGKAASYGTITTKPITDRQLRTQIHQNVRRMFKSTFESSSNADGTMKVAVGGKFSRGGGPHDSGRNDYHKQGQNRGQVKGKLGWAELGGEYLHFSLFKENKDTMEVISFLASKLYAQPKSFTFAGTKDRRGVTVQRVSLFRGIAKKLLNLNRDLRQSMVGNLKYEKHGLSLGDLQGNEFVITLRDCHFVDEPLDETMRIEATKQIVGESIKSMNEHGFLNYYGLQRFGAFSTGTHDVGRLILKGDFKGAVDAILSFNPDLLGANPEQEHTKFGRDDIARAFAIDMFHKKGDSEAAVRKLPWKFSAEIAIFRWLRGGRKNDYIGALLAIPRGLRLMYVHAYQSLVWNRAASERWAIFGNQVVEGDLVLTAVKNGKGEGDTNAEEVDESGEVIVKPAADDSALSLRDQFERARPLTKEDVSSGQYSIFDVVLPTPGFDVEYPKNQIGDFYTGFMASGEGGGLDPLDMRRPQKDFSLSGSYRKLLSQAKDMSFEVKLYSEATEQLAMTDLDRFYEGKTRPQPPQRYPQQPRPQQQSRFEQLPRFGQRQPQRQPQNPPAVQNNPWANFKGNLAESDKAMADEAKARAAARALEPPKEPAKVTDSFIETNANTGKRTGHRDTVVGQLKALAEGAGEIAVQEANEAKKSSAPEEIQLPATPAPASNLGNAGFELPPRQLGGQMDGTTDSMSEDKPEVGSELGDQALKRSADQMDSEMSVVDQANTEVAAKEPEAEDEATTVDSAPAPKKIAVIVTFKLGSSQYATMALRELMKSGGVQEYKSGFSGR